MNLILKEDFETFSHSCPHRELKTTGDTGTHYCKQTLKIEGCRVDICPRLRIKKRAKKSK